MDDRWREGDWDGDELTPERRWWVGWGGDAENLNTFRGAVASTGRTAYEAADKRIQMASADLDLTGDRCLVVPMEVDDLEDEAQIFEVQSRGAFTHSIAI